MSGETGGWLWIVVDIVAVLLFAVALIYGLSVWRKRRSTAANRYRDQKTEELHRRPDPDENAPLA